MFREMRRKRQMLSTDECIEFSIEHLSGKEAIELVRTK